MDAESGNDEIIDAVSINAAGTANAKRLQLRTGPECSQGSCLDISSGHIPPDISPSWTIPPPFLHGVGHSGSRQ